MAVPFQWSKRASDSESLFFLSGRVDENTDFRPILAEVDDHAVFDLSGIERMNSSGVMRWGRFIREVSDKVTELRLVRCSPVIVTQLNMIKDFSGDAQVTSFFAPYVCDDCGAEAEELLDIKDHRAELKDHRVPPVTCDECGSEMVLNSLEESYLGFLTPESLSG